MNKLELLNSEGPILVAHKVEGNPDLFLVEDRAKVKFELTREELESFVNGSAIFADSLGNLWDYEKESVGMKPSVETLQYFLAKGSL
jgi:hypothetical protein